MQASAHGNTTTKVKEVVTTKKEKGKPATKALRRESKTMAPAAEEVVMSPFIAFAVVRTQVVEIRRRLYSLELVTVLRSCLTRNPWLQICRSKAR